ncbi:MAG: SRPBCC family protein [Halobacteriales archaeon]|nr:SRPBCC family protein [Halobacteriales archaeon]
MPTLEARTTVYREPEVVFDALLDLRRYEAYSDHLDRVRRQGDGGVGTEYDLRFEWWLVGYTVRSRVTAIERPERIDFEVTSGIRADGSWHVEPVDTAPPEAGDGPATRVRFEVTYDPDSVAGSAVNLPSLMSLSWVVDRVAPMVEREARRVVERVVADLEGEERAVDLEVAVR